MSALLAPGPSIAAVLRNLRRLVAAPQFDAVAPTFRAHRFRPGLGLRRMDLYVPPWPGPHPGVVLVHGGGWVLGHRGMKPMRFLATRLVQAGFAVAVSDYRTVLRGGRIDIMLDDVMHAVRWARARPEIDPDRLHLCGLSAGGTLSMLAAAQLPTGTFCHVVSVFAAYDLHALDQGTVSRLLRPLVVGSRELLGKWSPMSGSAPQAPVTLVHGTADDLVPIHQAEAYRSRWHGAAFPVDLISYEGAGHGFFNDADDPFCLRGVGDLVRLFRAGAQAPATTGSP